MNSLKRNTLRLHLRFLELKDFEIWKSAQLKMLPAKNIWDLGPKPKTELNKTQFKKMLAAQLKRRKKDTHYDFAVFKKNGELIGVVSIMEVARGISQTAFLGYRVFNNYWGRGYAKEAVAAVIDIGFKDIKLHRIEAGIESRNKRSIALARSLKMRREGLKKRAIFLRQQWVDLLMYTLTTEDLKIPYSSKNIVR